MNDDVDDGGSVMTSMKRRYLTFRIKNKKNRNECRSIEQLISNIQQGRGQEKAKRGRRREERERKIKLIEVASTLLSSEMSLLRR